MPWQAPTTMDYTDEFYKWRSHSITSSFNKCLQIFTFAFLMMVHFSWKIHFAVCLAPVASAFFFPDVRCYARQQDNTWQAPVNSLNIIEHVQNIIRQKMISHIVVMFSPHTCTPYLYQFIKLNIWLRKGLGFLLWLLLKLPVGYVNWLSAFRASPSWIKWEHGSILLSDWALKDELGQVWTPGLL